MPGKLHSWEPTERERHLFHEIYVDETSQNDHHFLVLGGIIIPREMAAEFEAEMFEARPTRLRFNSKGERREMGWSEVSKGKFADYAKVLEAYFSFASRRLQHRGGVVKFYCSVVNTRIPGRSFSKGEHGQIGFDKELYSHCMHIGRIEKMELFHVYPDHRSTKQSVQDLALMLNRGISKKSDKRDYPFRRIRFRLSHEHSALQISDILIGAVAYKLNRHYDAPSANADKKLLCDYVLRKTGFDKYIGEKTFRPKTYGACQLWYRSSEAPPPTPDKPVTDVSRVPTR